MKAKIHDLRATLARRHTVRRARRRLSAELADFATAADRVELEQVLDRHTPEQTREIRAILNRQDAVQIPALF